MTTLRAPRPRDWAALVGFLVLCFGIAALGALATAGNVDGWYATADKPSFTPPNWLFGPVWTVLYALIAVSGWLVRHDRPALVAWSVQLVLNLAWSPLFFGLEQLWLGFAVIVALDLAVVWTIAAARRVRPVAAWLLVPYLAWVLFATALNLGLALLN
ncbi:TspO/MBR family protein [Actinokineospora bangkokensis]|uniref:TspO/MBR family protein n=1 Tax=Actinokineospora bangkokensis TaxID=1193682 RepID=UPI000B32CB78|nr:TspO/MBR family protein [Actinokineospora bangkokensis]